VSESVVTAWRMTVWAFVSAAALAAAPAKTLAQNGTIEGRITQEAAPQRRSANRYPGGAAASHEIQALPAVVYLVGAMPGSGSPSPAGAPVMAQRDTAFVPSVVAVATRGSVTFPNRDPFFHNVFSYSSAQRFDLGRYPQGE